MGALFATLLDALPFGLVMLYVFGGIYADSLFWNHRR